MAKAKANAAIRLERGEGSARVFWEITRTKATVTTRYGRHLSAGRQSPAKTFDSTAAAEKAVAEAIASKREEGYAEPPVRAEVGASSRKGVSVRNPELEAFIEEAPHDAERYLVYADWLQQQGDPRGELIVIQHGIATSTDAQQVSRLERDASALFKKYEKELLGPLAAHTFLRNTFRSYRTFSWRHGFIRGARLSRLHYKGIETSLVLAELLAHPAGRFLEHLVLRHLARDSSAILAVLRERAPITLTSVVVGDGSSEASNLEGLWSALPRLRALSVEGESERLGTMDAPALEVLRFGQANDATVVALRHARLARLKTLHLSLRATSEEQHVGDVLGAAFPALEHLGVRRWMVRDLGLPGATLLPQDDLALAVAAAAARRKLRRLDLDTPISARGTRALIADAAALRAIGAIHVPHEAVDEELRAPLAQALPQLVWTEAPEEEPPDLPEIDAG